MNQLFIRDVMFDWADVDEDSYLKDIPALYGLNKLEFHQPITFFVGENGSGKSTLLESIAVACGFNGEGGTKNYQFSTYEEEYELSRLIRLGKGAKRQRWGYFLRAENLYNFATQEEAYGGTGGYHYLSHGESLLSILQDNLEPDSLYLLDEPESALSAQRQLTFIIEVMRSVKAGAQFLICSHSPILLAIPGAEILTFDEGLVHPCEYEDTQAYRVTKMFLNQREGMLRKLLDTEL